MKFLEREDNLPSATLQALAYNSRIFFLRLWICRQRRNTSGLRNQMISSLFVMYKIIILYIISGFSELARLFFCLTPIVLLLLLQLLLAVLLEQVLSRVRLTRDKRQRSVDPCFSCAASSSLSMLRLSSCSFSDDASFSLKTNTCIVTNVQSGC